MRKYYITAVSTLLEKNKPLINVCALFRTESEAREFAEGLANTMEKTPVFVLEATVRELYLVILNHKTKGEIIVGVRDRAKADELRDEHAALFPTHSFSVRPFQQSDFIVKQGAFYA